MLLALHHPKMITKMRNYQQNMAIRANYYGDGSLGDVVPSDLQILGINRSTLDGVTKEHLNMVLDRNFIVVGGLNAAIEFDWRLRQQFLITPNPQDLKEWFLEHLGKEIREGEDFLR